MVMACTYQSDARTLPCGAVQGVYCSRDCAVRYNDASSAEMHLSISEAGPSTCPIFSVCIGVYSVHATYAHVLHKYDQWYCSRRLNIMHRFLLEVAHTRGGRADQGYCPNLIISDLVVESVIVVGLKNASPGVSVDIVDGVYVALGQARLGAIAHNVSDQPWYRCRCWERGGGPDKHLCACGVAKRSARSECAAPAQVLELGWALEH